MTIGVFYNSPRSFCTNKNNNIPPIKSKFLKNVLEKNKIFQTKQTIFMGNRLLVGN